MIITTGGQKGADLGAWEAAREMNVPTAGWMPARFRTEGRINENGFLTGDEHHPEFADIFGAREDSSYEYQPRTRRNVADCKAILLFGDETSPGSKLLLRAAKGKRPVLKIPKPIDKEQVVNFIRKHIVYPDDRLMVAGNRESSHPGIQSRVRSYMMLVLAIVGLWDVNDDIEESIRNGDS